MPEILFLGRRGSLPHLLLFMKNNLAGLVLITYRNFTRDIWEEKTNKIQKNNKNERENTKEGGG